MLVKKNGKEEEARGFGKGEERKETKEPPVKGHKQMRESSHAMLF